MTDTLQKFIPELKVWNELDRMFCSVRALLEVIDTENSRNTATFLVEESKIALQSISKDITYRGDSDFVTVESVDALNNIRNGFVQDMLDCLEIDVGIKGI